MARGEAEPPHLAAIEELAAGGEVAMGAGAPVIPGRRPGQIARRLLLYGFMIVVGLLFLVPFLWSLSTSFMPLPETAQGFHLIPNDPTIHAYHDLLTNPIINFVRVYGNSWLLAISVTLTNLVLASLGGYAFARLRFPGRELLFLLVLATLMIPDQLRLVPVFQMLSNFPLFHWNLINTYQGYILISVVTAVNLFLMRQYFLTIPKDYEEAARLDGAGHFKTFLRVMLPLAGPALAAVTILTFQGTWNDFFWAITVLQDPSHYNVNVAIQQFVQQYDTLWPQLMAGSVLAIAPIAIIYFIFQRYFVAGVAAAGVKG
jgi:multiple sugar transport system permease protein